MNKFITLTVLALTSATTPAAGFDCRKANTFIEQAICQDKQLSELDNALMTAYKKALTNDNKYRLLLEQRNWLKTKRKNCENAACLKKVYLSRINELGKDVAKPTNEKPVNIKENNSKSFASKAVSVKPANSKQVTLTPISSEPIRSKPLDIQPERDNGKSDHSTSNTPQNWEADVLKRIDDLMDKK